MLVWLQLISSLGQEWELLLLIEENPAAGWGVGDRDQLSALTKTCWLVFERRIKSHKTPGNPTSSR